MSGGFLRAFGALLVVALCAGTAAWAAWPRIAALTGAGTANPLGPRLTIRLASGDAAGSPWALHPLNDRMHLRLGETATTFYEADNATARKITGHTAYDVTPAAAEKYVVRIGCGCRAEQALGPHQTLDMPVSFYVDPAIAKDPKLAHLKTITLSLSFNEAKTPERQAALPLPPTLSTEPTRDRHGA